MASSNLKFPTSFWNQFTVVFSKMMVQIIRHRLILYILICHHVLMGVLAGLQFYKTGNNARYAIANFKYCVCVLVFFAYTYFMPTVLLFPFEVRLMKREYFNRWYGLKPYFLAFTLRSLPLMIILGQTFTSITYLLTNQPLEVLRFVKFSVASILVAMASEAMASAVASICSATTGSIVAPLTISPLGLLCMYGLGYQSEMHPVMKVVVNISYLRLGLVALIQSIYGDRPPLDCIDEIFCYYKDPKHTLKDAGMSDASYTLNVIGLVGYIILFRLIAYLSLRFRVRSEMSRLIAYYIVKKLQYKW